MKLVNFLAKKKLDCISRSTTFTAYCSESVDGNSKVVSH